MVLSYKWVFLTGFAILAILNLILPFQIEEKGGTYVTLFGQMGNTPVTVQQKSGMGLGFVWLLSIPFFISLIIAAFSKYKLGAIFGIITSSIQLIAFLPMAFGLTFTLNLFGPPRVIKLGFGFYTFCVLGLMLVVYMAFLVRQLPSKRYTLKEEELLDI